ncbi:MAG: response regulator [Candidatus Omnitrophota bacterium]|nr:response regulator [Candidatus Omnitrophota bacterium]
MVRVLIVDDEVKLAEVLKEFLTPRGFQVWTASAGEEALPLIQTHRPEVVLLDMCLGAGRLQGFEMLRQIRTQWPAITVLMWSGSANVEQKAEALRLGATTFFDKPVNLGELLRAMQVVNGHRQP